MENWNTGFYTGFKGNLTCFVICTKSGTNSSQQADFVKEKNFQPCSTEQPLNTRYRPSK